MKKVELRKANNKLTQTQIKKQNGITLVALVITIIILLILAGISIQVLTQQGLFGHAKRSKLETEIAREKEQIKMSVMSEMANTEYNNTINFDGLKNELEKYNDIETVEKVDTIPSEATIVSKTNKKFKLKELFITTSYAAEDREYAKVTYKSKRIYYVEIKGDNLGNIYEDPINKDNTTGGTTEGTNPPTIPEGLEVGSTVIYISSGTYDEWTTAHSGWISDQKIATGNNVPSGYTNMTIWSWKVYSIDTTTGIVKLVPDGTKVTTPELYLNGANGYNNAVKLLNDACNSLYGNGSTITARSISMEDIEPLLDTTALSTAKTNEGYNSTKGPYEAYYSNYPSIFELEDNQGGTLTRSSQTSWYSGKKPSSELSPKYTSYSMDFNTFSNALGANKDTFLPKGSSTNYWVASRCVFADSYYCDFYVRNVYSGQLCSSNMFISYDSDSGSSRSLFPIVSLNSELIKGDATSGFRVE